MRKLGILSVLFLVAACKGTDTVDPPVTTTVTVSSSAATIGINETAQASAIVRDQNGELLTGKTITWTSLNNGIATVTAAGLIRGVAAGTATIQGSVDGINGSATVTVLAPVTSCVGGPTAVDVAVGQVRVLSASETKGCIKVSSTAAGSQYVVIGGYTSSTPDVILNYTLKSDEGETVPSTTILANPMRIAAQLPIRQPELSSSLQMSFESKLRLAERAQLDVRTGRRAYRDRNRNLPGRLSLNAAIPVVGEQTQFKIPRTSQACANFTPITATARYISNRAIFYTDNANPTGGFTDLDFQEIGTEFDNLIYPTDVDYFGTPLDQDANQRVVILYTKEVNALTPAGNPGGFVGGFFFAGDLFPTTACAQSNLAEIFYVLAPDPAGAINGNARTTATVRQGTRGTIAHEFQHMINASERFRSPIEQDFEDVWLDEALSHFAEDLNGRVLKGLTNEAGNYSTTQILPSGGNTDDFNAFFFQNFARFQRYLQNPGQSSGISFTADTSLAARGASWALLRYTADHYAPNGNIKAFTKALAGGPNTGVNNLVTRAGGVSFDTLAAGWMVANYADDSGIPGLATKYTYKTYDMRSNIARITPNTSYPLTVQDLSGSGVVIANQLARSGSGNYYRFTRAAGGPARSFRFLNSDGTTAVSFASAVLIVLRSQ